MRYALSVGMQRGAGARGRSSIMKPLLIVMLITIVVPRFAYAETITIGNQTFWCPHTEASSTVVCSPFGHDLNQDIASGRAKAEVCGRGDVSVLLGAHEKRGAECERAWSAYLDRVGIAPPDDPEADEQTRAECNEWDYVRNAAERE